MHVIQGLTTNMSVARPIPVIQRYYPEYIEAYGVIFDICCHSFFSVTGFLRLFPRLYHIPQTKDAFRAINEWKRISLLKGDVQFNLNF